MPRYLYNIDQHVTRKSHSCRDYASIDYTANKRYASAVLLQ